MENSITYIIACSAAEKVCNRKSYPVTFIPLVNILPVRVQNSSPMFVFYFYHIFRHKWEIKSLTISRQEVFLSPFFMQKPWTLWSYHETWPQFLLLSNKAHSNFIRNASDLNEWILLVWLQQAPRDLTTTCDYSCSLLHKCRNCTISRDEHSLIHKGILLLYSSWH